MLVSAAEHRRYGREFTGYEPNDDDEALHPARRGESTFEDDIDGGEEDDDLPALPFFFPSTIWASSDLAAERPARRLVPLLRSLGGRERSSTAAEPPGKQSRPPPVPLAPPPLPKRPQAAPQRRICS